MRNGFLKLKNIVPAFVFVVFLVFVFIEVSSAKDTRTKDDAQYPEPQITVPESHLTDRELVRKSPKPERIATTSAPGTTEFTPASDADKTIKFKKGVGDDLDVYLFRDESPIDVFIDIGDLRPDPSITQKPKLTLRYWDVDRTGPGVAACEKGPEIDTIAINGHALPGELTGQSDEWNIKTYDIEPGWLVRGDNHFELHIDTTATDCWAVTVDWVEIKIPFNIKVVQVEAWDDLFITNEQRALIPDAVWKKRFGFSGTLIDVDPSRNESIADWLKSKKFKIKVKLDAWPKKPPDFTPTVEYSWLHHSLVGTAKEISSPDNLKFDGWEGEFEVDLSQKVGQRGLFLFFDFFDKADGKKVHKDLQLTGHRLYVTYDKSLSVGNRSLTDTLPPKERWVDVATRWAKDARDQFEVAGTTNLTEYSNPFGWEYGYPRVQDWDLLITPPFTPPHRTDCNYFAYVWRNLVRVNGVNASTHPYEPSSSFLTEPGWSALDNVGVNASLMPGGQSTWNFSSHCLGNVGGKFYDPTFGLSYFAKDTLVYAFGTGFRIERDGFWWSEYSKKDGSGFLLVRKTGIKNSRGWTVHNYQPRSSEANITEAIVPTSDIGLDTDSDTLYNYLAIQFTIDVPTPGIYGIDGSLHATDGTFITTGSLEQEGEAPLQDVHIFENYAAGINNVTLYFLGKHIFDSQMNGPYTVNLTLLNEAGEDANSTTYTTGSYAHTQFQGMKILVNNITDLGTDTDADGQFDSLTLDINADVLGSSLVDANIVGFLSQGETLISSNTYTNTHSPGNQIIQFTFPASDIRQARLNGPYSVLLSISDGSFFTDIVEHTTVAYSYTQFGSPAAEFSLAFSDAGIDTNANGLFDLLTLNVGLEVAEAGDYTILGWLANSTGDVIVSAESLATLPTGSQTIQLNFPGKEIYKSSQDGPYNLLSLTILDSLGNEVDSLDGAYTTSPYAYTEFEKPGASFTSVFSDSGVDADADGFYNTLRIAAQVNVSTPGTYTIEAHLADANESILEDITLTQSLSAGIQNVDLDFSGENIFSKGVDGSYLLSFARIISNSEVEDQLFDAFTTSNYSHTQFERPSIFISSFTDSGVDTNSNGLFNVLRIGVTVTTQVSGYYAINGRLMDSLGNEIGWAAASPFLVANTPQTVYLDFDGFEIRGNGQNGPYLLKDLSVYEDVSGSTIFITDAYTTAFYDDTQFEVPGIIKGKVTYSNGTAIPNVVVYNLVDTDTTDADGNYSLVVNQNGTYTVKTVAPAELNLIDQEKTVDAVVGIDTIIDFTFLSPGALPGTLVVELIEPSSSVNVLKNSLFNVTARVSCGAGDCGNVTAVLDPEIADYTITTIPSNFTDISLTGIDTGIIQDDDSAQVPIGFTATFYENTYSSILVSSNGYMTFGPFGIEYSNADIPDPFEPNNFVAPFWDDLNPGLGGAIKYQTIGSAPQRIFIVQWDNVPPYGGSSDDGTFQVKLYEESGDIEFQYADVSFSAPADFGASATVGVENSDGTKGSKFSFNAPVLYDGLGLLLQPKIGKGMVPVGAGTPFYTIDSNPMDKSILPCFAYMLDGTICDATWRVNATGSGTWEFFATFSSDVPQVLSSETNHINITIVEGCAPPLSGDWVITQDCTLEQSGAAPAHVIVQNNAILTLLPGVLLNIDFANFHLLVKNGSKVIIKPGGKLF